MPDGTRVHALLERASILALETDELAPLLELQINVAQGRARAFIDDSGQPPAVLPQGIAECIALAWSEVSSWSDAETRPGTASEQLFLDVAELHFLMVATK